LPSTTDHGLTTYCPIALCQQARGVTSLTSQPA
jgi:hypothetical protein